LTLGKYAFTLKNGRVVELTAPDLDRAKEDFLQWYGVSWKSLETMRKAVKAKEEEDDDE
jgi:hypothetical protein